MTKDLTYSSYLAVPELLELQRPISAEKGAMAHDEMLFIVVHQAFELWFKLILHELDSAISLLNSEYVEEKNIPWILHRLRRISKIQEVLHQQIEIIETMTPLDFMDFRSHLGTSSGFQSFQFRLIENRLRLMANKRLLYSERPYHDIFTPDVKKQIAESEAAPSLFSALDKWLSRTPFIEDKNFKFLDAYKDSVQQMLAEDLRGSESNPHLAAADKSRNRGQIESLTASFEPIFDAAVYEKLLDSGHRRLSYKAFVSALFINLYRDEPIFHLPFRLIEQIEEIDEKFALWRYRHALMVHKMLGRKIGTGGSSGYEYLQATIEKHRIFSDLFDMTTMMIPRSQLPTLPDSLKKRLGFYSA